MDTSVGSYSFCNGNPVKVVDSDGRIIQSLVGAAVGAIVDYSTQVTANILINGVSVDAFTKNIDIASIGVSSLSGAVSGGASSLKNVAKFAETAYSLFDVNVQDKTIRVRSASEIVRNKTLNSLGKTNRMLAGKISKKYAPRISNIFVGKNISRNGAKTKVRAANRKGSLVNKLGKRYRNFYNYKINQQKRKIENTVENNVNDYLSGSASNYLIKKK